MKTFFFCLLVLVNAGVFADEYVHGYIRSDGTYVQPHFRSSPDSNPYNNWSTRGNVNPYTGERGYTDPYRPLVQPEIQPYPYGRRHSLP